MSASAVAGRGRGRKRAAIPRATSQEDGPSRMHLTMRRPTAPIAPSSHAPTPGVEGEGSSASIATPPLLLVRSAHEPTPCARHNVLTCCASSFRVQMPACIARGCRGAGVNVPDERNMIRCQACDTRWQSSWWWDHLEARGRAARAASSHAEGVGRSSSIVDSPAREACAAELACAIESSTATTSIASQSSCGGSGGRSPSPCSESSASVIDGLSDGDDDHVRIFDDG